VVGSDGGRRRWRRGAGATAVAVLVAVAATPVGAQTEPAEPPDDVLVSGGEVLGTVSTQVVTVVPLVGNIALPVKIAAAGAQADGQVRRASSHVADLGLLGTLGIVAITGAPTLTRLGVPVSQFTGALKLPAASLADSRSTTDAEDRPVFPEVPVGPVTVGGGHQEAHAADGATAVARTELGDLTVDLGVVTVELNGGVAETVADGTHIAATTTVGEMRFLTSGAEIGALRGLVWRFEQVLDQPPTASFAFGSGRFGALEFPLAAQGAGDVAAALTAALAPLGVSLTLPVPRPDGGLSPLRLALEDSPAGAQFVRPLYSALLADAVNDAEAAIVAGVPETGLGLTVANVVLGALTGQGGVAVELGGITGSIGRRPVEEFAYGAFPAPPRPSLPSAIAASSPPPRPPAPSTTAAPTPAPTAPPSPPPPPVLTRLASVVAGEAVPALLVVLGGLGAALAMAAIDRRRISAIVGQGGAA